MRRIMVMNLGSTSFKFKLFEMAEEEKCAASGGVENIGGAGTFFTLINGERVKGECDSATHMDALETCMQALRGRGLNVDLASIDALGYKAVHGGRISGAQLVDDALIAEMRRMSDFAPAHNPVYLNMMTRMRQAYPDIPQIACFETAFHASIPLARAVYGVPYEWVARYGVRRYGFHGSSHSYIAWKMARVAPDARRLISIHLGGSCSLCAIHDGKSVANSMGATPQSGIFHNNRVGDMDVFCLPALVQDMGGLEPVMKALSSQSGLLGLSGVSNDLRQVEQAARDGNAQAQLAIDAFVDSIVGYIGMYTAFLGGLDAICFTGGIGTNDAALRRQVADRLTFVRARIDDQKNQDGSCEALHAPDSGIGIWAFETNEELMVARGCIRVLGA